VAAVVGCEEHEVAGGGQIVGRIVASTVASELGADLGEPARAALPELGGKIVRIVGKKVQSGALL
jgi:hypothetical protein